MFRTDATAPGGMLRGMGEADVPVRVTFDSQVNAAYIYLADEPALGWRHGHTVPILVNDQNGMVNIDINEDGLIRGIEILPAKGLLSEKILRAFEE